MKANEAPEKLYISDSELNDAEHCIIWFKSQQNYNDVEYTRTDAFIEKAAEWMFSQASVYTVTHVSNDGSIYNYFYADKMVEDFRKYMKGE